MSQPIPQKQQDMIAQKGAGYAIATPDGTPPASASHPHMPTPFTTESRWQQLLASFDHHDLDRAERQTSQERKMSFGEPLPTPPSSQPSSRRPSFLSGLTLSRFTSNSSNNQPFSNPSSGASTPLTTPSTPAQPAHGHGQSSRASSFSHHGLPAGLQMTSSSATVPTMNAVSKSDPIERPKSTPTVPSDPQQVSIPPPSTSQVSPSGGEGGATSMQRSNTLPYQPKPEPLPAGTARKGEGMKFLHRKGSLGQGIGARPPIMTGLTAADVNQQMEKRHFDPSKEPRLLGLL